MHRTLQATLLVLAAFAGMACWVLLSFFPAFPRSIVGWLAICLVGVPTLLAGEYLVQVIFQPKFLGTWPSWARISYGLVAALAVLGLTAPVVIAVANLIAA